MKDSLHLSPIYTYLQWQACFFEATFCYLDQSFNSVDVLLICMHTVSTIVILFDASLNYTL